MADAFGLNDYSLLNGAQQTTARQIQDAFTASQGAYGRQLERYTIPTSGPMVAQHLQDAALRRAQVTAAALNQNQQLQDIIDAANHTPHGVDQNLAAYLPYLGAGNALMTTLFGRQAGGALSNNGLFGLAKNGWNAITHPGTGTTYNYDPQTGQVTNSGWGGGQYQYPSDMGAPSDGFAPDAGFGSGIDQVPVDSSGGFGDLSGFGGFDAGDAAGFLG